MSGASARRAAVSFASWRWYSAAVVAPRDVGKPAPAPSPFMRFSTLPMQTRSEPAAAGGSTRGLASANTGASVGSTM